jgi:hypothetical protein
MSNDAQHYRWLHELHRTGVRATQCLPRSHEMFGYLGSAQQSVWQHDFARQSELPFVLSGPYPACCRWQFPGRDDRDGRRMGYRHRGSCGRQRCHPGLGRRSIHRQCDGPLQIYVCSPETCHNPVCCSRPSISNTHRSYRPLSKTALVGFGERHRAGNRSCTNGPEHPAVGSRATHRRHDHRPHRLAQSELGWYDEGTSQPPYVGMCALDDLNHRLGLSDALYYTMVVPQ